MNAPKIPEGQDWDIVRNAFRAVHLDPNNPEDWPLLLKGYIETVHRRARAGRNREWTDERLIKLASEVARVQGERLAKLASDPARGQDDLPNISDSDTCRALAKHEDYSGLTADTLRRRLQDARDPEYNGFLARLIDEFATEYEVEGGNTREQLRIWLTTGFTYYWEDKAGNLHSTPPEPPPANAPADWPGRGASVSSKNS